MKNKKLNTTNKLSILFTKNGFSYISTIQGKQRFDSIQVNTNAEHKYIHFVKSYFSSSELLSEKYQEVNVYFNSNKFTLVPNDLFDEELAGNYLQLNTQVSYNDSIRYNVNLDYKFVLVFSYIEKLERFVEAKYSNITYFHSIFSFIEKIKPKKNTVEFHLNFYKNSFDLVAFKGGRLIVATNYEFNSNEDVLYHVLNYAKQQEMISEKTKVYFYGSILENDNKIKLLSEYFLVMPNEKTTFERNYICLI
ncbi:MAG: DUF3822 family protein [Flavobacteriales bacterium]|nr:DUF3822 family protein [Flavobacteriales bacterium]